MPFLSRFLVGLMVASVGLSAVAKPTRKVATASSEAQALEIVAANIEKERGKLAAAKEALAAAKADANGERWKIGLGAGVVAGAGGAAVGAAFALSGGGTEAHVKTGKIIAMVAGVVIFTGIVAIADGAYELYLDKKQMETARQNIVLAEQALAIQSQEAENN